MEHLARGKAAVLALDGSVEWESGPLENALLNQGEQDVLNVYILEQAHKTKYLALFNMPGANDPLETDTLSTIGANESKAPGAGGYARQQVVPADWGAPALVGEDYKTTIGTAKVFGPFSATSAFVTHVMLVTTSTGTASPGTLMIASIALGTQVEVAVGLTFSFTPSIAAF